MGGWFQTSGSNVVILRKHSDGFLAGRFCSSSSVDVGWLLCRIISTAVKNFRVETTNGSKLFLDVLFCLSTDFLREFPGFLCICHMGEQAGPKCGHLSQIINKNSTEGVFNWKKINKSDG